MDENRRLLGLDCEGEKRKKKVQNRLERKENELIGFLKRDFNIGYHLGSQMISQKQQVAWWLKYFQVTNMA